MPFWSKTIRRYLKLLTLFDKFPFPLIPRMNIKIDAILKIIIKKSPRIIRTLPPVPPILRLILIPLKQSLNLLIPQHQHILLQIIIDRILRNLILIIIIILFDTRRHVGGLDLAPLQPQEIYIFHPIMPLQLFDPTVAQPTLRIALEELNEESGTWLMKSRASKDHLFGSYSGLMQACLLRTWSRIYLRLRPTYGRLPSMN